MILYITVVIVEKYSKSSKRVNLASVKAAKKGLRKLVEFDDKGGEYAWRVLS